MGFEKINPLKPRLILRLGGLENRKFCGDGASPTDNEPEVSQDNTAKACATIVREIERILLAVHDAELAGVTSRQPNRDPRTSDGLTIGCAAPLGRDDFWGC